MVETSVINKLRKNMKLYVLERKNVYFKTSSPWKIYFLNLAHGVKMFNVLRLRRRENYFESGLLIKC